MRRKKKSGQGPQGAPLGEGPTADSERTPAPVGEMEEGHAALTGAALEERSEEPPGAEDGERDAPNGEQDGASGRWTEEEAEEADPGEEAAAGLRGLGLGAKLLAWLGLVLLALVILLGAALALLYATTDMDNVPQAQLLFDGQAIEAAEYHWSVPVAGPLRRTFSRTLSEEPQSLGMIETPTPRLETAGGFEISLTCQNQAGETVFEGSSQSFEVFSFSQNGSYTVTLTASRAADRQTLGHIPEGSYTYRFSFVLNSAPQLLLSRESVAQGSAFVLRLTGVLEDDMPRLQAEFAPEAIFVQLGRDWVACLDVPYDCPTGDYEIQVSSGENTLTQQVYVYARQLRELDTNTPDGSALAPYIGALPSALEPYMAIADPDVYFTGGFIQPVKGALLRDYYVNEYADRIVDPVLLELVPELVAEYNAAITPRLSLNLTFSLNPGTAVSCPADGRVIFAGVVDGGGRTLVIEHGCGLKSLFYLMNQVNVSEGDFVYRGDTLGTTNHHLICEMRLNGTPINPWDVWRNLGGLSAG